jgi:von Willebrand factor type A domain
MRGSSKLVSGAVAFTTWALVAHGCSSAGNDSGFPDAGGTGDNGSDASTGNNNGGNDAAYGSDVLLPSNDSGGNTLLDAGCATATATVARQPVYMLIVLDGSGSMAMENKWTAVVPALDAFFDDLLNNPDPSFGVGLTIFSDRNDPQCGGGSFGNCVGPYSTMNVPIADVSATQAAALHSRLDNTSPENGTPTVAVLQGQYAALDAYTPVSPLPPGGKKVLVLMTDGVPNDAANDPQATLQNECISQATAQFAMTPPVITFAVGIGDYSPLDTTNYDPAFMGALAVAGGDPRMGCMPGNTTDPTMMCHFQITPGGSTATAIEQQFIAAINAIRGEVASCTFALEEPDGGGMIDPTKVNVVYNDGMGNLTTIDEDPANGWTYNDPNNPTSVTLNGTSCSTLKMSSGGSISIVLGCATMMPH